MNESFELESTMTRIQTPESKIEGLVEDQKQVRTKFIFRVAMLKLLRKCII